MITGDISYSSLKIFRHPEKLAALRQGRVTAPIYIRIKPVNVCDHACEYCSYRDTQSITNAGFRPQDCIPREKMREIIADCAAMGVKAVTFSGGGEPLLYPHMEETLEQVLAAGIDLSLITHGQRLNGRCAELLLRARWVRISLDSCDARTYAATRHIAGHCFDQVVDNIRSFVRRKPRELELGINCVVNRHNSNRVYDMACFARDLGVGHIKFSAMWSEDMRRYHQPFRRSVEEQLTRSRQELAGEQFRIVDKYRSDFYDSDYRERTYHFCPIKEIVPVIGADQNVYFCHDKAFSQSGVLGSVREQSFRTLWFSHATRERFRQVDPAAMCRHHCAYHDRNVLINAFLQLDDQHGNFI